jgi:hypothetical protein
MGQEEKNRVKGETCLTTLDALCYSLTMPPKGSASVTHLYEIEHKGKIIRCLNLKAMKAALEQLEGSTLVREAKTWTAEEFHNFTGRIHVPQRRLLAKLLEIGPRQGLEDSALRELLELPDNQSLDGSLSGISKVALMFDIEPRRVYVTSTVYKHSKPRRSYQITPEFAEAATRHKWPSKGDLKYK